MVLQVSQEKGQFNNTWSRFSGCAEQKIHKFWSAGKIPLLHNLTFVLSLSSNASHMKNSTFGGAKCIHTVQTKLSTSTAVSMDSSWHSNFALYSFFPLQVKVSALFGTG
uniref:Uncharacterized protein n=1 Tax=Opuntia streptacantha TaxID=393608 RepID=A0A7C9DLN6_OPUST